MADFSFARANARSDGDDDARPLSLIEIEPAEMPDLAGPIAHLASFSLAEFLTSEIVAPGFVVEGLFPRGDVTVFAARSGIGKSFLMLQAAVCVAAGRPFLGQPVQAGTAVGLFWEDPAHVLRDRLIGLLAALEIEAHNVERRLILSSFNAQIPELHTLWRNEKATRALDDLDDALGLIDDLALLVVDTAKIVFRGPIVDTEGVRYFIGALRALAARRNVAVILVTHTNRAGDTSGTTEWENHARAVVHLKPHADRFRLEVVKTNYAAPIAPLPLARTLNGAWTLQPAAERPPVAAKPKASSAEKARDAFLAGFDTITQPLSANKNSPKNNYAPKVIVKTERAKQLRVGLPALEAALTALLAEGVVVEVVGPGKHKTKVLARPNEALSAPS